MPFSSWVFLNISELINGFSQVGDVALSKDNVVWSTPEWSDEFKIEFDVIVDKELPIDWVNIMHMTTGNDNGLGARIPGVWAHQNKFFYSCFRVNGNDDYCQNYDYQLDKLYHFEISQHKKPSQYYSTGEAIYSITVNGEVIHEIINTISNWLNLRDVDIWERKTGRETVVIPWSGSFS